MIDIELLPREAACELREFMLSGKTGSVIIELHYVGGELKKSITSQKSHIDHSKGHRVER